MHLLRLQDGSPLVFKTISDTCPHCGKRMERKRAKEREIITLAGGAMTMAEEYYVCPRCRVMETGRRVIHHSEALRSILPPNTKYGYDVEIEVGYLKYADNKQMDEISCILEDAYGISVPHSKIHELGIRFLMHMVVSHYLSAPLLRKLFEPSCVYHVDATCEAGRGMELTVKEGWTGIVLGAWKIATENEEVIKQHLKSTVEMFGEPAAFVSDMGNGMMSAISGLIQELRLKSRHLICHMHFLKAVGKSILDDTTKALKSQLKGRGTLAQLNNFVKETGNIIKPKAADMREFLTCWHKSGAQMDIPGDLEGIAVLRALAQWVILYSADCGGEGFPFAMPSVMLFDRCTSALGSLLNLCGKDRLSERAIKHAARLRQIVAGVVGDPEIQKTVQDLKERVTVFTELRNTLRLEKTDIYKQAKDKAISDELEVVATLKEETSRFRGTLCGKLEDGAGSDAYASATRTILAYLDKYGRYLFDHFVTSHDASGGIVIKMIERTNNIMERSYRDQKHKIRRRTGIKNLGFVFEHLFPAAAMMDNLENPAYVETVLNNRTRADLAELFSTLDDIMDYRDTPMFQDDLQVVGGRLPTADKKIVGKAAFTEVVTMLAVEYINSSNL